MENEVTTSIPVPVPVSELYNSSPSKVQPWILPTGGIPPRATMSGGDVDNTHGIAQGNWLIMGNAPIGLRPKGDK